MHSFENEAPLILILLLPRRGRASRRPHIANTRPDLFHLIMTTLSKTTVATSQRPLHPPPSSSRFLASSTSAEPFRSPAKSSTSQSPSSTQQQRKRRRTRASNSSTGDTVLWRRRRSPHFHDLTDQGDAFGSQTPDPTLSLTNSNTASPPRDPPRQLDADLVCPIPADHEEIPNASGHVAAIYVHRRSLCRRW